MRYDNGNGFGAAASGCCHGYVAYGRANGDGQSSAPLARMIFLYTAEHWYHPRTIVPPTYQYAIQLHPTAA